MKRVLIGCFAIIIAACLFAFTTPNAKKQVNRTQTTYVYTGDNTLSQQRDAQWYIKDNNGLPCSGAEEKICLIVTATDEGDHPDFSGGNPVDNAGMFDQVSKRPNN